jgi:glutathione S-transferase
MLHLVIGNKNYSSWSMRPWVLLKHFEIEFKETRIPLFVEGYQEELAKYSPTLRVPVLIDGDTRVWDSMAIAEYVNEKYLGNNALPEKMEQRALCRAYCAEMHSGFLAIRNELPMNIRAKREISLSVEVIAEVKRIETLWCDTRNQYSAAGDYLFGKFTLADCMYAPVAMRFHTYGISLSETSSAYVETLLAVASN